MSRAEQITMASGTPSLTLMEAAGRGVTEEVVRRFPRGSKVIVLCGPGKNGGDGFVCARNLRERGYQVRVALFCKLDELGPDAKEMARRWDETIEPMTARSLEGSEVIVDAVWGSGLKGPVNGIVGQLIEQATEREMPVVAVDVPTGIDLTYGNVHGVAFKAVSTVTFFRRKTGHVLLPGKRYCGDVRAIDIGIPNAVLAEIVPQTFLNEPDFWLRYFPRLKSDGHKYDRGHAVVVSGPMESTGAARLAARASLRVGAGLVSVATSKAAFYINAAQLTSIMVSAFEGAGGLAEILHSDPRRNAVLIGPGAGATPETRENVAAVLSSDATTVIDAEGLTAFSDNPQELFGLIQQRTAPTILTPHKGEFDRIFPELGNAESKLEQAKRAAEISGAVVVFKGPDTVVSAPDGLSAISENSPPWLATAGTGDVLAGLIVGLCAQGMSPLDAAVAGVWIHSDLARTYGPGLIAEDMAEMLPALLQRMNKMAKLF
ncbi:MULTISPECIES: NAD(P)H-hydrate dehydratase [Rhodomicrobium]|uniref:NAD(P)H-hydrate dehydratase n=1 Tax=Rhodomicrobium TaxID=1068 RepID=UPI001FDA6F1C|nr:MULTISPECIES: NAD(P)H-hydrate dehydratase [Rhodomicrobium]